MVVVDWGNNVIRSVAMEGAVVSTLTGDRQEDDEQNDYVEEAVTEGHGANVSFHQTMVVVVSVNSDIFISDRDNQLSSCTGKTSS